MSIRGLLEEKIKLRDTVGFLLSESERVFAVRDFHAKRPPRPCGITVHTAIGCIFQCKYCYIYDMGFKREVKPYPLTGLQLVYALLSNKYFIPGLRGTYLAIGSISEPFHPLIVDKTLEYVECFYRYLNNPVQFSTKAYINKQVAVKLANLSSKRISPLVTIVTLSESRNLEPYAPSPEKRFESIRNMRETGLKPFLFLRPIIPGLTEREYKEIIDLAAEYGAIGVIAGGLRVTKRILRELREIGVDTSIIHKRLEIPVEKMREGVQYDVYTSDIKAEISDYVRHKGLLFFPSACMANLYTHNISCWKMRLMGIELSEKPREIKIEDVKSTIEDLGVRAQRIVFSSGELKVYITGKVDSKLLSEILRSSFLTCTTIISVKE
ncbi:MAG: radical SAM protein [Desulfurococcaceae archaeon]|jgi:DNA repair photolyase|nr:radical SAM protein [Desulfurococcaceae archaeon]